MLRRIVSVVLVLIVLTCSLLSLGCAASPLDPAFSEEKVLSAAEDMAALINAREYAAASEKFSDVLRAAIPADKLSSVFDPVLDQLGAFQETKKSIVAGETDQSTGEAYAVCILVLQYENGTAQLTLSINAGYELIGIFIK